ncbi:MAG: TetR/AcrR family transcriptional regulator [Bacteroidota bacterium]
MGIAERKNREKQDLREKIIQAASELFLQHGLMGTSVRMIAQKIEYSPATIYNYFESKEELYALVIKRGFQLLHGYTKPTINIQNPVHRIHAMAESFMQFARDYPNYYRLLPMLKGLPRDGPKSRKEIYLLLENSVKICLGNNQFSHYHLGTTSVFIWVMLHGLATLAITGEVGSPMPPLEKRLSDSAFLPLFDMMLSGLIGANHKN